MEGNLRIKEVVITSDVFRNCFFHSMVTSGEEIAGLLFGEYAEDFTKFECIVKIYASVCVERKIKEKDRVEIGPM